MRSSRITPTPTVLLAIVAIIIAMGGSSYAGVKLAKNSVGTKQLKNDAVKTSKVKDGTLVAADFSAGQLPQASPHAFYDAQAGDIDVNGGKVVNALTLPAGTWVLLETLNAVSQGPDTTSTTRLECSMANQGTVLDFAKVRLGPQPVDPSQFARIAMTGAVTTSVPVTITVTCFSTAGFSLIAQNRHLVAMPQTGLN